MQLRVRCGLCLWGLIGLFILLAPPTLARADSAANYRVAVLADNPVSYWRLNEPSGITAADQQGRNPGTIYGGVTLGQPGALSGDASMAFDGSFGHIDLGSAASLQPAAALSVEAWVKTTSSGVAFESGNTGSTYTTSGYFLTIGTAGNPSFTIGSPIYTSGVHITGPASVADGAWHHLVGTYDGTTMRLYVDGTESVSALRSLSITYYPSATATVAGNLFGTSGLAGAIDEVAVYDHALTAAQVFAHYRAAAVGAPNNGAVTGSAVNVTTSTADLTGAINPGGVPTRWYFEYGLTPDYGAFAPPGPVYGDAGSGSSDVPVSVAVGNLQPATTYHFRLVGLAGASSSPRHGQDATFTTPPSVVPQSLGPWNLDTPKVRDSAWWLNCNSDVGYCDFVIFDYEISGDISGQVFEFAHSPIRYFLPTHAVARATVPGGRSNVWGIKLTVNVGAYVRENWQRLPCLYSGQALDAGQLPLPPLDELRNTNDAFLTVLGDVPARFTAYDPELTVNATAVSDEWGIEQGLQGFAMRSPTAGQVNHCGLPARDSRAEGSPMLRTGAGGTPSPPAEAARARRQLPVPFVKLDGRRVSRKLILRAMEVVHRSSGNPLAAVSTMRQAVALVVREFLIGAAAAHQVVRQPMLQLALNQLVMAYDANPSAARRAGLILRAGESAHHYFFSRIKQYRGLAAVGAIRNSILGHARTGEDRRQRFRLWMRQQLRTHRLVVRGLGRFSLSRYLPRGL